MQFTLDYNGQSQPNQIFKDYLGMKIWQQRHLAVSRLIEKHKIKQVLDIACSDGKLIQRLSRDCTMELLVGIDIDPKVLQQACHNTMPQPIQQDIKYQRKKPLTVEIYCGDATLPHPVLLSHFCQLVTMIQLIQHLQPQQLPKLNHTVFSYLNPKFVMITTPNQQFNQFFNLQTGLFRHWDHKYQWTRAQFREYCESVKMKYGYQYEIFGVGEHCERKDKGCCSQGAVFIRQEESIYFKDAQRQFHSESKFYESQKPVDGKLRYAFSSNKKPQINGQTLISNTCRLLKAYNFPFWKDNIQKDISWALDGISNMIVKQHKGEFDISTTFSQLTKKFIQSRIGRCLTSACEKVDEHFLISHLRNSKYYQYSFHNSTIKIQPKPIESEQEEEEIGDQDRKIVQEAHYQKMDY